MCWFFLVRIWCNLGSCSQKFSFSTVCLSSVLSQGSCMTWKLLASWRYQDGNSCLRWLLENNFKGNVDLWLPQLAVLTQSNPAFLVQSLQFDSRFYSCFEAMKHFSVQNDRIVDQFYFTKRVSECFLWRWWGRWTSIILFFWKKWLQVLQNRIILAKTFKVFAKNREWWCDPIMK